MKKEQADRTISDEHLQENEKIEAAIAALQQEPTQELLAHALTVIRRQMNAGGQLIIAVEMSAATPQMNARTIKTQDGGCWWFAFTSFDEEIRGSDQVMSTFLTNMRQLFEITLKTDGINGLIINPWNKTIMLDKKLIQIILGENQ